MDTPAEWRRESYVVSTDPSELQLARIHRFLSEEAYWCLGIPELVVRRAAENSLCFGLYYLEPDTSYLQIGYARVVTDRATFAWICDVYVEAGFRGKGLAKWLLECVMAHPALQGLRRICLATRDAHGLYRQLGFEVTRTPEFWMEIKVNYRV